MHYHPLVLPMPLSWTFRSKCILLAYPFVIQWLTAASHQSSMRLIFFFFFGVIENFWHQVKTFFFFFLNLSTQLILPAEVGNSEHSGLQRAQRISAFSSWRLGVVDTAAVRHISAAGGCISTKTCHLESLHQTPYLEVIFLHAAICFQQSNLKTNSHINKVIFQFSL